MLSMYEVAPHRSVRGIKLSVGETRIEAPRKGCRGLTQVEFDPASMVGATGNIKDAGDLRRTERRNKNGLSALRLLFPEGKRSDREEIHHEKDLLLRQPRDKGAVGVVETEIAQLERGAAQSDGPLLVERLVGKRRGRISED